MKRAIQFLFAILCVTALVFFFFGFNRHAQRSFQGYVEGENLYLASPFDGQLVEKLVNRGQRVKKGDLLFVLNPSPQDFTINQIKAELNTRENTLTDLRKPKREFEIKMIQEQVKQADANLALAGLRLKRYSELYQKHAVELDRVDEARNTEKIYEAIKSEYESNLGLAHLGARINQIKAQESNVIAVQAQLSLAEWNLAQKSLIAPADGVIFDTYYLQGEYVPATRPVATLLPDAQIRIEFFVPVDMLARIHLDKSIEIRCDGCELRRAAHISYIAPEAEYVPPLVYSRDNQEHLVFRIKADLPEPTDFKPGQPVQVWIEPDHG